MDRIAHAAAVLEDQVRTWPLEDVLSMEETLRLSSFARQGLFMHLSDALETGRITREEAGTAARILGAGECELDGWAALATTGSRLAVLLILQETAEREV